MLEGRQWIMAADPDTQINGSRIWHRALRSLHDRSMDPRKVEMDECQPQIGNSQIAPVLTTTWDELEPEGREDILVCLLRGEG